jgi:hypothetical protein
MQGWHQVGTKQGQGRVEAESGGEESQPEFQPELFSNENQRFPN